MLLISTPCISLNKMMFNRLQKCFVHRCSMKNVQQVNYKEVVILNHVVLEITCDMFINKTSLDIFEQVAESMAISINCFHQ